MESKENRSVGEKAALFFTRFKRGDNAVYAAICELIRPYIAKETDVLELCCGAGAVSYRIADHAGFYEATDPSEKQIRKAAKDNPKTNLHFSVQNPAALPYAAGTFDVVIITGALGTAAHPEKILSEISRVLKDEGTLIAPEYVQPSAGQAAAGSVLIRISGVRKGPRWTAAGYIDFLIDHGFLVTEHRKIMEKTGRPVCFAATQKKS